MDSQLVDSSSDSDISNSWSIVDQELCDAQISQRDNSVDKESISGSDGDSLEVIEDEEKRDADEFRDADVETDGISIITESEINEELDQTLAWTEPKEKKYLHHPNTYLNSRLNVLLAVSLAAVFGLGLGHFLGLQEECPLLNESATKEIEKLQQENQLLRKQLERLLHNEITLPMAFQTALDSTCNNDKCLVKKQISEDLVENKKYLKGSDWKLPSSNNPDLKPFVSKEAVVDFNSGSTEKPPASIQDYVRNIEPEWVRTYPWPKAAEADEEVNPSANMYNVNNKQSNLKVSYNIHFQNVKGSQIDTKDSENTASVENVFVMDSIKQNFKDEDKKEQVPYNRKDHNIEAVRMALSLLESHFTIDDRTSADAKDTLSSAQSLTSDLEQSLVHLQTAITNGEIDRSGFFGQVLKRMKESVNRVMNTMEEVADDVDEQMHKVLYKLTRKLKKLKGKLQEKWCHFSEKYNNKSHPMVDWLQSTILVGCKKPRDKSIEEEVSIPKERTASKNEFSAPYLSTKNEKELPESIKNIKFSHTGKNKYNDFGELDAENILLKPKLELNNEPPLIIDTPVIISKTFSEPEQTMSSELDEHDIHASHKTYAETNNFNSEAPCWKAENGKMYCEKLDKKVDLGRESVKMPEKDEKASPKKSKSPKSAQIVEEKSKANPEDQKSKYVRSKPMKQRGWVLPDINNNVQKNASGEWMMKLAKGRAEQRRLIHRSDWVFDRAHARRIQRDMDKKKAQWYFQRAQGREYCRYHPKSEDCQTSKPHNFHWDDSNVDIKYRKHYTEDKSHYFSKWSKKFGKWMKNSFSDWHKVKYHSQH